MADIASAQEECVGGLMKLAADLELNRELVLAVVPRVVPRRDLTSAGLEAFRSLSASVF